MSHFVPDSDIGRRRRERAVDALERIDGIVAAAVQLGDGTRVDAVRLAIAPGISTERAREQSLAALRELGFDIDFGAVLVAPIGGDPVQPGVPAPALPHAAAPASEPQAAAKEVPDMPADNGPTDQILDDQGPPPAWHGRFLVLGGVDVRRSDARVTCTVRLQRLGDSFSAEVTELDTTQGRARAAARAALLAAEQAGEGVGLSLEGVVIQEFFGRQYVMAFVDGVSHRRFASLSGILAVDHSLETAAALAILRPYLDPA